MLLWQKSVYDWMKDNLECNTNPDTGEVNTAMLAEDCRWNGPTLGLSLLTDRVGDALSEIAFAVVEQDANRMSEVEAKKYVEDYGGER